MNKYSEYEFFYSGPFSQWHKSNFRNNPAINDLEFNTAEQYMMYTKALMFEDYEIADQIMLESNPRAQKALGRKVKGFNAEKWNIVARDVVYYGNYLKFSQNLDLKELLFTTKGKLLVEASPYDKIWGIGLAMKDAIGLDRKYWKGTNWLGEAITKVRENLLIGEENK